VVNVFSSAGRGHAAFLAVGRRTLKLTFADSQTAAIRQALACRVLVITGGQGVGKTTIVITCVSCLRAAKRMTEATGVEAKTIHRFWSPIRRGF
jgi:ATP-dependent exoDNAse (exonuclease V) alpha subunit